MNKKILLVDDEEKVLQALERTFASAGYQIFSATSGEDGLTILLHCNNMERPFNCQRAFFSLKALPP